VEYIWLMLGVRVGVGLRQKNTIMQNASIFWESPGYMLTCLRRIQNGQMVLVYTCIVGIPAPLFTVGAFMAVTPSSIANLLSLGELEDSISKEIHKIKNIFLSCH
jgi:hypothetical protein